MESSYFLDPHCITLVIVSHWLLCYTGYCITLVIVLHWLLHNLKVPRFNPPSLYSSAHPLSSFS